MRHTRAEQLRGSALIITSALSYGTMAIFARIAYHAGVDPITLLFLRFSIAGGLMLALIAVRHLRLPRGRSLSGLIGLGAIGYVGQSLCYFTALTLASAGLVALLLYIYPVVVTLLVAIFFRERITGKTAFALVLALAGIVLTIGPQGGGHLLGILLGLGSGIIYGVYIVVGSRMTADVAPIPSATVITVSAAVVYALLALNRGYHPPGTPQAWLAIIAIALLSTVIAIVTFLAGLDLIGPTSAAVLSTFEPVTTVLLSALVIGEAITPLRIVGGVLILVAVVLLSLWRSADGVRTKLDRVEPNVASGVDPGI